MALSVRVAASSHDKPSVSSSRAECEAAATRYQLDDPTSDLSLAAGQLIARVLNVGTPLPQTANEKKIEAAEGNLMQSCTRFTPKEKADAQEGAKELVQSIKEMEEKGMICRHDGTRAPRQATATSSADSPEETPPIAASFVVDLDNHDDEDLSSIPPGDMLDDVVQRYNEAHCLDDDM